MFVAWSEELTELYWLLASKILRTYCIESGSTLAKTIDLWIISNEPVGSICDDLGSTGEFTYCDELDE